jgi:DNA-binding response OmpR family regulator
MNEKQLVLIVDDEPQIRRLLTVTLEANGYRVVTAASGQEGLVLAAQHQPALVILDIGLPDLSGQEVLRRLREWSAAPVVILSVRDDEKGKVTALDAGADDYVTKPFNTDELLARVRVALRHSSTKEDAFCGAREKPGRRFCHAAGDGRRGGSETFQNRIRFAPSARASCREGFDPPANTAGRVGAGP